MTVGQGHQAFPRKSAFDHPSLAIFSLQRDPMVGTEHTCISGSVASVQTDPQSLEKHDTDATNAIMFGMQLQGKIPFLQSCAWEDTPIILDNAFVVIITARS